MSTGRRTDLLRTVTATNTRPRGARSSPVRVSPSAQVKNGKKPQKKCFIEDEFFFVAGRLGCSRDHRLILVSINSTFKDTKLENKQMLSGK